MDSSNTFGAIVIVCVCKAVSLCNFVHDVAEPWSQKLNVLRNCGRVAGEIRNKNTPAMKHT